MILKVAMANESVVNYRVVGIVGVTGGLSLTIANKCIILGISDGLSCF